MSIKKIGVLHGAILNGGDFLICKRGTLLLDRYLDSDFELVHVKRWESFEGDFDALIIVGGPIISRSMITQTEKIYEYMEKNEVPVIALGIGISSEDYDSFDHYFTDESLHFWEKVYNSSNMISVRDKLTHSLLNHVDVAARFTGCPALFDLDNIHKMDNVFRKWDRSCKNISFTIPNLRLEKNSPLWNLVRHFHNFFLSIFFISYMNIKFKREKIDNNCFLILQHGFNPLINVISWYCKLWGIKSVDASNRSLDEVEEMLSSDVHIGTRLHAHILFLSARKPSYLFNVDYRTKAFLSTFNSDYEINYSLKGIRKLVKLASHELPYPEKINTRVKKSNKTISKYFKKMDNYLRNLNQFLS